ncbi:class I SAM-dependent methyltransferase [Evansella sp. AB-P1]|uniref:class I SAM-dependent methyltransferase n=1 Tax=Evansella sp. AB-P1 TaxID=3037653 RepID=UPI00241BF5BD|nr:class I SAM-dependent methyltransferase [Evansella sp. AB-P1]MDG5787821.1 class I SAM-dependent methyltransferase [Evansella sp. AB-P1]
MDFYSTLSNYYDDIFATNEKAISLIESLVLQKTGAISVLDLAAGTGAEAAKLTQKGYNVVATDINEDMVSLMNKKNSHLLKPFHAKQMNMKDIGTLSPQTFDIILCIGNSFVHLDSHNEMIDVLDDCYERLNNNGILIIQTVNYDRIFEKNIMELPIIINEEKEIQFERSYKLEDPWIIFEGKITIKNNEETNELKNVTKLLPLKKDSFVNIIKKSSFSHFDIFGSFNKEEFTINSPALVAVLRKV